MYRIVNTDNFARDWPNEKFIGLEYETREDAQRVADELNLHAFERWHKVVKMPYELEPGFEP